MDRALFLADAMRQAGCGLKFGLEFFSAQGPQGVREIRRFCKDVPLFLDLKFHDIPNTVAGALRAVADLGPAYVNVHAAGGTAMMRAAADALNESAALAGIAVPGLLAVTALTSLDADDFRETGIVRPMDEHVRDLALLTQRSGLSGVVCAAAEIENLRAACGPGFILMVPGIRPAGTEGRDDQKRTMTPARALAAGASHLVIGRPITGAADPAATARAILDELKESQRGIRT